MATDTAPTDQQQPQQQAPDDHAVLAAITLILMSGLPFAPTAAYLTGLLTPLGIPQQDVEAVAALVVPRLGQVVLRSEGVAQGFTNRTQFAHTAAYFLAASRRLAQGGSVDAERRYLSQHLAARMARQSAAKQVDQAAATHGPVVGWHATMDSATTAACRAAHGHNFSAASPPVVGWPGTLHGGTCRCTVGPPFPDAGWVDDAVRSLPAGTV